MNKLNQYSKNNLHFWWLIVAVICVISTYFYIKAKATDNYNSILQKAASTCSLGVVELLIKDIAPELRETALHSAAKVGCLDIIKFLILEGKVSIDFPDKYAFKRTALHHAAAHGHIEVVKFLLENGANPNIEDNDHRKPIKMAIMESRYDKDNKKNYKEIIKLLAQAEKKYESK